MTSTPLWVPLVVGLLAVVGSIGGTVAGVLITQRRSDRREREVWDRERQRERDQWAREDQLRTFEQRRDVYVEFFESVREMAGQAQMQVMGFSGEPFLPDGWQAPTYHKMQRLRLFASLPVIEAAAIAYQKAYHLGERPPGSNLSAHERDEDYDAAELVLYNAIRADLGVPASEMATRPPGGRRTPAPDDPDPTP